MPLSQEAFLATRRPIYIHMIQEHNYPPSQCTDHLKDFLNCQESFQLASRDPISKLHRFMFMLLVSSSLLLKAVIQREGYFQVFVFKI